MKKFVIKKYTEFMDGIKGTYLKAYNADISRGRVWFEETKICEDGNEIIVDGTRILNRSEIEEIILKTYGKECRVIIDF